MGPTPDGIVRLRPVRVLLPYPLVDTGGRALPGQECWVVEEYRGGDWYEGEHFSTERAARAHYPHAAGAS